MLPIVLNAEGNRIFILNNCVYFLTKLFLKKCLCFILTIQINIRCKISLTAEQNSYSDEISMLLIDFIHRWLDAHNFKRNYKQD